jgi:hypothetical protein
VTSRVSPASTDSMSSTVLAIVPMEIAISTMPTIAVTTKIEIAQMIPAHFGFFATGPPGLE